LTAYGITGRGAFSKVTKKSNALDLDAGVVTCDDPQRIATSLKRSAEASNRRKAEAFRSTLRPPLAQGGKIRRR